jgi:hypothetical protein
MKSPLLQTWIRQFRERDATGTETFFTWNFFPGGSKSFIGFINNNKIFMSPIWSWISLASGDGINLGWCVGEWVAAVQSNDYLKVILRNVLIVVF